MTDKRGRLVAVTGGTGFLGPHIADALRAAGWSVRLLVRRRPAAAGSDIVPGSLFDDAALDRLLQGADAVVHAAGRIKAVSRAEFLRVNRDGSHRLAAAVMRQPRPPRVVAVSSLAAREPRLSAYAESKRAGEEALREAGIADLAVVRSAAVYGPGDRETAVFLRAADGPVLPVPRVPGGRVALIHAADAAAAVAALAPPGMPGGVFEISDRRIDGYGWRELAEEILAASGGRARIVEVPRAVFRAVAGLNAAAGHATGRAVMLAPGKVRELFHPDWSSARDRQPPPEIWSPRVDLRDGLRQTLRWLNAAAPAETKDARYAD
ncbi:NAD-dependent epimerase/dehydratase family protein [Oleispirillum naphthae]|uniref:NAD-dependent epimerase/dehydratase family protein n=1 Tax=Oleispirillum naphthae TaxID=2838853 RepID=UPI0030823C54